MRLREMFLAGLQGMMDAMYPPTKEELDARIYNKMAELKQRVAAGRDLSGEK